MLMVYTKQGDAIQCIEISGEQHLPEDAMWVDIVNPTPEESKSVVSQLGIHIPTQEEIWKNQVLNRFFRDNGFSYMTAAIITKINSPHPQTSTLTFVLGKKILVTLRHITPTSFKTFSDRLLQHSQYFVSSDDIMEGLLEEIITRVAYNSEIVISELDLLSHDIFDMDVFDNNKKNQSRNMNKVLKRLGKISDLNSMVNESLHSLNRMLVFFQKSQGKNCADNDDHGKEIGDAVSMLISDVDALTKQTAFLSDKITFLLDATLGMINVEQNLIIKIFSVVAVFFLPPTLISSIYGMNFHAMPELNWLLGYPFSISLMLTCALVSYLYFRRRGWL